MGELEQYQTARKAEFYHDVGKYVKMIGKVVFFGCLAATALTGLEAGTGNSNIIGTVLPLDLGTTALGGLVIGAGEFIQQRVGSSPTEE